MESWLQSYAEVNENHHVNLKGSTEEQLPTPQIYLHQQKPQAITWRSTDLANLAVGVKPIAVRSATVEVVGGLLRLAAAALLGGDRGGHDQRSSLASSGGLAIDEAGGAAGGP